MVWNTFAGRENLPSPVFSTNFCVRVSQSDVLRCLCLYLLASVYPSVWWGGGAGGILLRVSKTHVWGSIRCDVWKWARLKYARATALCSSQHPFLPAPLISSLRVFGWKWIIWCFPHISHEERSAFSCLALLMMSRRSNLGVTSCRKIWWFENGVKMAPISMTQCLA